MSARAQPCLLLAIVANRQVSHADAQSGHASLLPSGGSVGTAAGRHKGHAGLVQAEGR